MEKTIIRETVNGHNGHSEKQQLSDKQHSAKSDKHLRDLERQEAFRKLREQAHMQHMIYTNKRACIIMERNKAILRGQPVEEARQLAGKQISIAKAEYNLIAWQIHHQRKALHLAFA